jgi:phenylalanyl-tRNA synthetase alpha chain
MKDRLKQIMDEAMAQIDSSDKLDKLNEIKVSFLGKKGELTSILKSMKDVAPEDRPKVGQMMPAVRLRSIWRRKRKPLSRHSVRKR